MNPSFKFDMFIFRSCYATGKPEVSTRLSELFKISSEYYPYSFTDSSLFVGGSPFVLFTSISLSVGNYVFYDGKNFGLLVPCCCFFGFSELLLQIIIPAVYN